MQGPLTDTSLAAGLPPVLADHWGIRGASVEPLGGGMNSATATVTTPVGVYVAKWVPPRDVDRMARGCAIAATLAAAGMSTGAPSQPSTVRSPCLWPGERSLSGCGHLAIRSRETTTPSRR